MCKVLGITFLIGIAAYIQFGNTVTDVNYKVKTAYGELPTYFANKSVTYHVPGVVRIAGADIHRPEGYFTQSVMKMPKEGAGKDGGAVVKGMNVGSSKKMDIKKAKLLGLEPEFTFWEESGKWVLLLGVLCLLFVFFWR